LSKKRGFLTQNRVTYLLGAGASVDSNLPKASDLTARIIQVLNTLDDSFCFHPLADVMNYVVSAILVHQGRAGGRPDVMPDIESVVSAVELLSERDYVELTPFVQNWDPAVNALGRARQSSHFWRRNDNEQMFNSDVRLLQELRSQLESEFGLGGRDIRYNELLEELMRQLKTLLRIEDPAIVDYLRPLVDQGRNSLISVATLNYDLTLETAAIRAGIDASRGLTRWNKEWLLEWPNVGVKIMKLHGSIDWERQTETRRQSDGELALDHQIVIEIPDPHSSSSLPFLIYGRREKLRPEGPFLQLRAEFIEDLRQSSHLVVVGYSFTDDHVNELIRKWVNADRERLLTVVDPNFPEDDWPAMTDNDFQLELISGLQRQNGSGIRDTVDSRLLILREPAKAALPKVCVGADELDRLLADSLNH
jgi:hypothetical protein